MKQSVFGSTAIQQGSITLFSDYVDGGPMWTGQGQRESRKSIHFDAAFQSVPAVMVGISLWDADQKTNLRAEIAAENITPAQFDLVFRTWGDTRMARVRADWTAIGPVRDPDDWGEV